MSNTGHFLQDTLKYLRVASEANGSKEIERYTEMVRRLAEISTTPLNAKTMALCPKCGRDMTLKAILPHPIIAGMKRYAYVCAPCDQARTYYQPNKPPQLTGEHSSSTERWKDAPRGTMDEVSSFVRLDLPFV